MNIIPKIIVFVFCFTTGLSVFARDNNGALIDRLLNCEDEKRDMDRVIEDLKFQLEEAKRGPITIIERVWSCQIGCKGLGNTGFGSGSTRAEAETNARQNFGFTCSPPPIVTCDYEEVEKPL